MINQKAQTVVPDRNISFIRQEQPSNEMEERRLANAARALDKHVKQKKSGNRVCETRNVDVEVW